MYEVTMYEVTRLYILELMSLQQIMDRISQYNLDLWMPRSVTVFLC